MGPFEVEAKHIGMLGPIPLTRLLKRLLYLEATACGIPLSATHVPLEINVPDGGEDGRIKWDGGNDRTDFLPKRFTLFQVKSKEMGPADCYNEILTKDGVALKVQIGQVLDANGAYIVFCEKGYVGQQVDERVGKIREALQAHGRVDWETAHIEFYDGNKIATWANKYLAAQIYIRSYAGQGVPWGLKNWEDLAQHEDFTQDYIWNDKLKEYKENLQKELGGAGKSVVRITGLSGIGKTRLALEVFRGEDTANLVLRNNILYLDAAGGNEGFVKFIADSRSNGLRAILIIDNCDAGLHERFAREMGYGRHNIKLITIDYDLLKVNSGTKLIHITPDDCKGIVKGIMQKRYPGLSGSVIDRIEEFAQNFANIAVLLAKQVQDGARDIGLISNELLVKKLLWGRGAEDDEVISIIKACSLFEHVEFETDKYTNNIEFLADKIACVDHSKFFGTCRKYLDLGILQRRGGFIRVCPVPLAITLAAEWWKEHPSDEILTLVEEIGKAGLLEQFCKQAKMLHFSSDAKAVVDKLCGPQGPFGKMEVLLSDGGSRLFLALAEVNPQATIETLWKELGGKSRDELLEVKDSVRRNIVWALERLCWWEDTFQKAAKLLLRLGAAENEKWGNNATEQFKQLFQIYLAGTQVNLNVRLQIIREALDSKIKEENILGVLALGRAIKTDSFSRSGSVESQGSRVPGKDYEPTGEEIREYWTNCINLLKDIIVAGRELSSLVRQELGTEIRGLLQSGMIDEIEGAIKEIVKEKGAYWPEALNSIRNCLDYDGTDFPTGIRERIDALEKILQPEDLEEKLRLVVSIPDWRHRKNEKGNYEDISTEEAEKLAHQLAGDNSWFKLSKIIFEGEQRQAYSFGKALGQAMPAGLREEFIEVCLNILKEVGREKGNPDVLGAFIGNIPDEGLVEKTIERIIQDETLCVYSVWIIRFQNLTEKHLEKLLSLEEKKKISISDLRVLSYGRVLDKIKEESVSAFCQTIANHSQEGANVALDIIYMYSHKSDERFLKCASACRNIVTRKGLLIGEKHAQMAGHNWETVANKLLKIKRDIELAIFLAEEIILICGSDKIPRDIIYYNSKRVLEVLLKEYFDECWDIIGNAILGKEWSTKHYLENILGPGFEKEEADALIARITIDGLLRWCNQNLPNGPAAIARLTPVFSGEKDRTSWHPLARKLIDEFGTIEEVRNNLSSNLCSFASWGSRAPYYKKRIDLLTELLSHSKKEVREWASSNIEYFEKESEAERRADEEREWGIH